MYPWFRLSLWLILALSLALLASNQTRGHESASEALTLVALGCGFALLFSGILTMLS